MCDVIWYWISKWRISDERLVAGGHMTKAPATIMYASGVPRETFKIALMVAPLNDLEVTSGNILNPYVQTPVTEKVWTTWGLESSKDTRKSAVIVEHYIV